MKIVESLSTRSGWRSGVWRSLRSTLFGLAAPNLRLGLTDHLNSKPPKQKERRKEGEMERQKDRKVRKDGEREEERRRRECMTISPLINTFWVSTEDRERVT